MNDSTLPCVERLYVYQIGFKCINICIHTKIQMGCAPSRRKTASCFQRYDWVRYIYIYNSYNLYINAFPRSTEREREQLRVLTEAIARVKCIQLTCDIYCYIYIHTPLSRQHCTNDRRISFDGSDVRHLGLRHPQY